MQKTGSTSNLTSSTGAIAKASPSANKRYSLQDSQITPSPSPLRKTKSHNFGQIKSVKKKPLAPSIPEDDDSDDSSSTPKKVSSKTTVVVENEVSKGTKKKKMSRTSTQSFVYENAAFEGNLKRNDSGVNSSIRSNARAPSVQGSDVYKEQYCCCAKRTKCEKQLLTALVILAIVVVVLVIVLAVIASDKKVEGLKLSL